MKTNSVEIVDSLSLLALKVASNVFDLSSSLHHISIRDQIVRAQMAVRDLCKADDAIDTLLIVGAGVAGISAALTAVELRVREVIVIEAADKPFAHLHGTKQRHVGPFMYEWPSSFYADQSYPQHRQTSWIDSESPLAWKSKDPIAADKLAEKLETSLEERLAYLAGLGKGAPKIFVGVHKWLLQQFVDVFAKTEGARSLASTAGNHVPAPAVFQLANSRNWLGGAHVNVVAVPQYVLLAAGMGAENTSLTGDSGSFRGAPFWSDDDLLGPGTADRQISIFGGGDGALQDVLRALTGLQHPLAFIKELEAKPRIRTALARISPDLLSMDRHARNFSAWSHGSSGFESIDDRCRDVTKELAKDDRIVRRVLRLIRPGRGSVELYVREGYFDKAYLLNRFLVHLIDACMRRRISGWQTRMSLDIHWRRQAISSSIQGLGHIVEVKGASGHELHYADRVVVRYGIEKGTVPGAQMIQLSDRESKQRTTLARVELPFVPTRL